MSRCDTCGVCRAESDAAPCFVCESKCRACDGDVLTATDCCDECGLSADAEFAALLDARLAAGVAHVLADGAGRMVAMSYRCAA